MSFIAAVAEVLKTLAPFASDRLDDVAAEYAAKYLTNFYLDKATPPAPSDVARAVLDAQKDLDLSQDGWVGDITLKAMKTTPRCGCRTVERLGGQVNQWLARKAKTDGISYHVVKYVDGLQPAEQEEILKAAWESWEKVCGIKLKRIKSEQADIIISASASSREEFGQAGNVLAWCELPQGPNHTSQLLCKFDLAETWLRLGTSARGIFMQNVACHEFGHGIGLDHVNNQRGQLMFPTYDPNIWEPQNGYDIGQAQLRYGSPTVAPPTSPVDPPTPPQPPVPPVDPNDITITGFISIQGKPYKLVRA